MKNIKLKLMILGMGIFLIQACDDGLSTDDQTSLDEPFNAEAITDSLLSLPSEDLSPEEIDGLILMREEEKLARDVYLELYDTHGMRIFTNIANSEQTHTYTVGVLLEKYDLEDPVVNDDRGEFTDTLMQELYTGLTDQGKSSLLDALLVGMTIEDLDIKDLIELEAQSDNEDILRVYESLRKGSRNHMRSFYSKVLQNGGAYEAQFISQALMDSIIATPKETGGGF